MVGILGANSVSGGYEIDNSLRFNNDDSPRLSFTPSSAGNRRTFTLSVWFKLQAGTTGERILLAADDADSGDNGNFDYIALNAGDKLIMYGYEGSENQSIITTQLLRDPSAWYHFVAAVDTTQSTASNRVKFYLNGSQITAFDTANYPSENFETRINNSNPQKISRYPDQDASYFDGYMAEYHLVDGSAKAPTDFGETDDNGVWIPKAYTGSYGTNGFYLEFKETGTSQNSSGIGADTSGNDNHWAVTNLAATDVTTDTPTNNFATFNSIFVNARSGFTPSTLREGNTGATGVNADGNVSTIGLNKGKWYWEIKIVTRVSNDMNIYLLSIPGPHSGVSASRTMMWQSQDDLYFNNNQTSATKTADLVSFDDDDIVAVALDLDASTPNVILYKNGTALNSGNAYDFNADERDGGNFIFPALGIENTSDDGLINFGNPAFAISSGNADANGYGNFEYAVPSGYFAICSKNLAEFG
jgi:hypothetical protein